MNRRLCLEAVAAAVLLAAVEGCCLNVEDVEREEKLEGAFADDDLEQIRTEQTNEDERCEAACLELAMQEGYTPEEVASCWAGGNMQTEDPWDAANTEVKVECIARSSSPGFCTGRRPQGHHEAQRAVASVGTWLAVHAHLERASVTAFEELAAWLEERGAGELAARCRAAAHDEIVHAHLMESFASRAGADVEPVRADPPSRRLLDVALHNAVEGCVHEAFAAIVAARQASDASDPIHREAFARIARDELRHGQLAWDLHAWLLDQLDDDGRATVRAAQREALRALPDRAAANASATPPSLGWPLPEHARALATHFADLVA